jgi:hypothetical protein
MDIDFFLEQIVMVDSGDEGGIVKSLIISSCIVIKTILFDVKNIEPDVVN